MRAMRCARAREEGAIAGCGRGIIVGIAIVGFDFFSFLSFRDDVSSHDAAMREGDERVEGVFLMCAYRQR